MLTRALAIALTQPAELPPAFLDAYDRVTVWTGPTSSERELRERSRVIVDGRVVRIRAVEGRQKLPPVRDASFVNLPGTLQGALGGSDWDPAGDATRMEAVSNGVYELAVRLRAGRYEYKLARGGTWSENYGRDFAPGGGNLVLFVPSDGIVRFQVDFQAKTIRNSIDDPSLPAPTSVPARRREPDRFTSYSLVLDQPLKPDDVVRAVRLQVGGRMFRVFPRDVLADRSFRSSAPLGARWGARQTYFATWAPTARAAFVDLDGRRVAMRPIGGGVWRTSIAGDLHGARYRFVFRRESEESVAADVNGYGATVDCEWSVVVDPARANPTRWKPVHLFQGKSMTDAVLYEAHVRDLTADPASGVPEPFRGKYLGLTIDALPLRHLKGLGATHVHLLPFQNFNPGNSKNYNWGYETTLFNVPEEQYATRPNDPIAVVRECKSMIQSLHDAGLGVVMDVVYNHTVPSQGPRSAFWQTTPYAWFRTNDRGDVLNESGVGNALNDDQPMVRRYVCDSLRYWAREYAIDGFRFDLIGMFRPESVKAFAEAIRAENPSAIVYGEPWTGGGPLRFPKGAQRGLNVGVFNDDFRNAFRGEMDVVRPNFLRGSGGDLNAIQRAMAGSIESFASSPIETINYLSCHDNMTLDDRLAGEEDAIRFGLAVTILAQGVPFIEGGVELGRTKGGSNNSYNGGDAVNRYDWTRAERFGPLTEYLRSLIALRRATPELRLGTADEIRRRMKFLSVTAPNTVAYTIDGDHPLLVVLHGDRARHTIAAPAGKWRALSAPTGPGHDAEGELALDGLGAFVFRRM